MDTCIWCIIFPILFLLLAAFLGYLLGRRKGKEEVNNWKEKVTNLEADLEACNKSKTTLKSQHTADLNIWRDKTTKLETSLDTNNKLNLKNKEDSLQIWNTKLSKLENDNKLSLQSHSNDLDTWKNKVIKLEKELEECRKNNLNLKSQSGDLDIWKNKIVKLEEDLELSNKTNLSLKSISGDLDIWKNKATKLEEALNLSNKAKMNLTADLSACKQSRSRLETDLTNANNKLSTSLAAASVIAFNGDAAKAVFGKKIKQDDLKLVEGIGPKIEGLFHNFEIKTWKALSETSVEKCQEVLNSGGDRYKIHNPGTWPKQAELAYEAKWAELLKWQDELDGGKA